MKKRKLPKSLTVTHYQPGIQKCRVTVSQYVNNGITRTGYRNSFIIFNASHLEVQYAVECALAKLSMRRR